jgi:hypothetical protein
MGSRLFFFFACVLVSRSAFELLQNDDEALLKYLKAESLEKYFTVFQREDIQFIAVCLFIILESLSTQDNTASALNRKRSPRIGDRAY